MTVVARCVRLVWRTAAASLAPLLLSTPTAAQGSVDVGEVVVAPREGGSRTQFSLQLPEGAACPGDSANDGYRIQSYMVPASVDPTTVTYDGTGPIPYVYGRYADFRQPLYDIESNSFVSGQTAEAAAPGEPGPIVDLPSFDFAVFGSGQLPAGRYHVGIACTLRNEITTVWDTHLVVAEATDDEPAEIHWTVAGAGAEASDSGPPTLVLLVVGGAAVAGISFFVRRPRRSDPISPSLEDA